MSCLECLESQIQDDFSSDLVFRYGISDSALPFASSAVVQVNPTASPEDRSTCDDAGVQFVIVSLTCRDSAFPHFKTSFNTLPNDEYSCQVPKVASPIESVHEPQDISEVHDDSVPSASLSNDSQSFPNLDGNILQAVAPVAVVGTGSYSVLEDIALRFKSNTFEDQVVSSLNLFADEKPSGRYAAEFLNLIDLHEFDEVTSPCSVRHPNITPLMGVLKTPNHVNLLYPKAPYTLENILHYSPNMMSSDWQIRFLIYQIVSAVAYLHRLGVSHGNISPSNIFLTDSCWSWLNICDKHFLRVSLKLEHTVSSTRTPCCLGKCPCKSLFADTKLPLSIDWYSAFKQWWAGELSNFDYLLVLNKLAGRRWGDYTFHTVMPWVIDFSVKPDENSNVGWRDLQKSKWRLAKGDEQLDFTYLTSEIPHHVSDECLSELAVCSYKARRLPLHVLRSAVRSVYEPNEYPSNMQRLYQWTPDECIPEFYSDPRIFVSLNPGMSDLAVPSWASSPEEFISLHRGALESDRVSQQIHHWINITFGYKLSGHAAITAKNVMLSPSDTTIPKSTGRRQLFTEPHPMRRGSKPSSEEYQVSLQVSKSKCWVGSNSNSSDKKHLLPETCYLQELEHMALFCSHAENLSPIYCYQDSVFRDISCADGPSSEQHTVEFSLDPEHISSGQPNFDLSCLLEYFEADDSCSVRFQELLHWKQKSYSEISSKGLSDDMFSIGCILAELYLQKPLFDSVSLAAYAESGVAPGLMVELPPNIALLVEECIHRDWRRRPSAKHFLKSQYFPASVRSAYMFVAPLQLLAKPGARLQYAAKLAIKGIFKAMGPFALEMCVPYCTPLILRSLSDAESEAALCLLRELVKCLKTEAIKTLVVPVIQKILQNPECSRLKISLLQESFVQEVWKHLGKQVYLEKVHPFVISNMYNSPQKLSASAASVFLLSSIEELGVPVTLHQTILPLLCCFGKGICADGIDALVRIGGLLGERFIVKQLLPLLRNFVLSFIDASSKNKTEPLQSWSSSALINSFTTLDGLAATLPSEVVLREFVMDQICLHVKVLMQNHLDLHAVQVAATTLIALCVRIGPDFTTLHVLPQLKDLFDELAFSQEANNKPHPIGGDPRPSLANLDEETEQAHIRSRMDLVLLLYPSFASLVGIEKLRQCCATWLLLEQYLQRFHNWKWEFQGESSRSLEKANTQRMFLGKSSASEYYPAKMLLNEVGWSIPQSQRPTGNNDISYKHRNLKQDANLKKNTFTNHEPWFWFPSPPVCWDGPEFLGRTIGLKDNLPWKIKASVLYSSRAHPGTLRSLAVWHDECIVFTGGVGPGFKGTVQKWELPGVNCVSGYYGHDEVVNDICILSTSGRIASCDGTIHVWNSQTGKLIAAYTEQSMSQPHGGGVALPSRVGSDQTSMLTTASLSGGILSSTFGGNLYTCMHYLEADDMLVVGMGDSSIRFIDVAQDRKLHLWKNEIASYSLSSLVTTICSCGPGKYQAGDFTGNSSCFAAGLSSGHCRLLDKRSGDIISYWKAHDSYVTKLAQSQDHLLVSSSLDRTLRVWDLRKNLSSQSNILKGHSDGISSFAVWGKDIISVSRNKIGISSLSMPFEEGGQGQQQVTPLKLYSADRGMRNLSVLSTICILPFSRLFLVGTEDGHLNICC